MTPSQSKIKTSTLSSSSLLGSDSFITLAMLVCVEKVRGTIGDATRDAMALVARGAKAEAALILAIHMVVKTVLVAVNFMVVVC